MILRLLAFFAALLAPLHAETASPSPTSAPFDKPAQPLPQSGRLIIRPDLELVAPFEIKAAIGTNYFLKLTDTQTGQDALAVFIAGGTSLKLKAPLGTYTIKYATGDAWYGYLYLFGPATHFSKATDDFVFDQKIDPVYATKIQDINRDLARSDLALKKYLLANGFDTKTTDLMFDPGEPGDKVTGLDRFDNAWWKRNILSKIKNQALYNGIVDRLDARNRAANKRADLLSEAETTVKGYTITLYKVKDGNLQTKPIPRYEF